MTYKVMTQQCQRALDSTCIVMPNIVMACTVMAQQCQRVLDSTVSVLAVLAAAEYPQRLDEINVVNALDPRDRTLCACMHACARARSFACAHARACTPCLSAAAARVIHEGSDIHVIWGALAVVKRQNRNTAIAVRRTRARGPGFDQVMREVGRRAVVALHCEQARATEQRGVTDVELMSEVSWVVECDGGDAPLLDVQCG